MFAWAHEDRTERNKTKMRAHMCVNGHHLDVWNEAASQTSLIQAHMDKKEDHNKGGDGGDSKGQEGKGREGKVFALASVFSFS